MSAADQIDTEVKMRLLLDFASRIGSGHTTINGAKVEATFIAGDVIVCIGDAQIIIDEIGYDRQRRESFEEAR